MGEFLSILIQALIQDFITDSKNFKEFVFRASLITCCIFFILTASFGFCFQILYVISAIYLIILIIGFFYYKSTS